MDYQLPMHEQEMLDEMLGFLRLLVGCLLHSLIRKLFSLT